MGFNKQEVKTGFFLKPSNASPRNEMLCFSAFFNPNFPDKVALWLLSRATTIKFEFETCFSCQSINLTINGDNLYLIEIYNDNFWY